MRLDARIRRGAALATCGSVGCLVALVVAACTAPAGATSPGTSVVADVTWRVAEVVDGDTLRVDRGGHTETVRLVGINAPERGECWADEATAALTALVDHGPVRLQRDVSDRDRYGRLLRYVLDASGRDIGGLLIDGGYAIVRAYPPDTGRDAEYRAREDAAREAGRGAWARDACGPLPSGAVMGDSIRIEVHPDAAGDDVLNLDDEWVRFTNVGLEPLDLDGWMVRDESSSHRYRFGPLRLDVGGSVTLRSGCGVDTDTDRYWCVSGSAIWNNGSDTVFLLDPAGNVVARLGYPTPDTAPGAATLGPPTAPP